MKRFAFPLQRVLDWRRIQSRIEESKLELLRAELRALESRSAEINEELEQAASTVSHASAVSGADLAALDAYRHAVLNERARLNQMARGCQDRIARQSEVVTQKSRDVKLLERLYERRFQTWKGETARALDEEAEELHLARFR